MPVPNYLKQQRRIMVYAGRPISQEIEVNTYARRQVALALSVLMQPYGGRPFERIFKPGYFPARLCQSRDNYRARLGTAREVAGHYRGAQLAGERNIFADRP